MASAQKDPGSVNGSKTILVVEDEEPIRRLMTRMLQMQGFQTLEAADGIEALSVCEEYSGSISLIITDMVMPKLSGKQLVEELHKKYENIKVLFMSGYSSEDTVDGEELGLEVAFIPKPFTQDSLAQKVREVLEG